MLSLIKEDLKRYGTKEGVLSFLRTFYLNVGFQSVLVFRFQSLLYEKRMLGLSYLFHHLNFYFFGIDILPGAIIGPGLRIEHPSGIVIGAQVKIGSHCTIMQGVTLGASRVLENNDNNFPEIGQRVLIGANASVLGGILVSDDTKIGAHSLVLKSCSPGTIIKGVYS
jgi:serine O-acetyltransferase